MLTIHDVFFEQFWSSFNWNILWTFDKSRNTQSDSRGVQHHFRFRSICIPRAVCTFSTLFFSTFLSLNVHHVQDHPTTTWNLASTCFARNSLWHSSRGVHRTSGGIFPFRHVSGDLTLIRRSCVWWELFAVGTRREYGKFEPGPMPPVASIWDFWEG